MKNFVGAISAGRIDSDIGLCNKELHHYSIFQLEKGGRKMNNGAGQPVKAVL